MKNVNKNQKKVNFSEVVQKIVSHKEYIAQKISEGKKHELKGKLKFAKSL